MGENESSCNHCGSRLPDTAKVCIACGSYQGSAPDHPAIRCKACQIWIPRDAKICTKCGSVQAFRGYVNVSQTTLTLAIALISVLSATAPVFKALLARSSTSFQLVRVSETHKLLVLAKNKGSRASYFRDATFVFEHHGNANQMLHIAEPDNERIIPPGSMKLFRLSVEPGWNSAKPGVPKEGDLLRDRFWIKARISGVWEGREPVVRADMADLTKVVKGRAF